MDVCVHVCITGFLSYGKVEVNYIYFSPFVCFTLSNSTQNPLKILDSAVSLSELHLISQHLYKKLFLYIL